jgi:DNA (cytosine-5)-methyltransferase 1
VVWAVLDAQYFGVAQRRRRLFIVGHSGGQPRPEVLALSEGVSGHPAPSREPRQGSTSSGVVGSYGDGTYTGTVTPMRRATPLEYERLQGFPDGWTATPGNSDTQRYRQMGNAVAVPVVEWVMRRIAGPAK